MVDEYEDPRQDPDQLEGPDVWQDVDDPQPHQNFPLAALVDGATIKCTIVAGPYKPARWSKYNEIDMVIENEDGDRMILAPGKTLAARMRDLDPPPGPGTKLRIEQQGDGYDKDWLVERI